MIIIVGVLFNIAVSCRILHKGSHPIWKCHMGWGMLICMLFYMTAGVFCICKREIYIFSCIYYLSWLMVMAYIDYYTGYVYECMEYAAIMPVLISVISMYRVYSNAVYGGSFIISVLMYSLIIHIMSFYGCIGEGDRDVMILNSVIITSGILNSDYGIRGMHSLIMECIVGNMTFAMLASVLFIIRNIKYIKVKNLSLKERKPFLPSIYMASVFFIFYKIGFTFVLI